MIVPVVDALRALLPVGEGVRVDDNVSQPAKPHPRTLYVWPMRIGQQVLADEPQGRVENAFLRVGVLYTLGARGEPRVQDRERALSVRLDTELEAIMDAIYANRRHRPEEGEPLWWDAYVEQVGFDAVRNEDARGHGLTVVLRINTPPAIGG